MLIHGLAVVLSVALVSSLRLPPEPTIFTWNVAVVEAPSPVAEARPASEPVPPVPTKARPQPAEPKAVAQRIQPSQTVPKQVAQRAEAVEVPQAVRSIEPIVQQTVQSVTPIAQARPSQTAETPLWSTPLQSRPVQAVEAASQTQPVTLDTVTVVETVQTQPSETEALAAPQALHRETRREARLETRSAVRTEAPAIVNTPAPMAPLKEQAPIVTAKAAGPTPAAIQELRLRPGPQKQRDDYGWLIAALRQSLQKVRPTLERGGRLRLMLRIRQDGNQVDLVDLAVAESSGYVAVDRKAIEVVRQAFPLEHTRRLDNQEVSINMPFRLDVIEPR